MSLASTLPSSTPHWSKLLMRHHGSAAIGLGGATALDFTLPIIQKAGGIQVVPVAVVSGFLLSLLGPVLMLTFLSFH